MKLLGYVLLLIEIKMKGQAGTLESNDCLITVEKSSKLEIIINSPVAYLYEDEIKRLF